MKGHGEKLSRKKEQAIKALLENDTHADAAKAAGIAEATLWRWLKEPEFKEAFRSAKLRVLEEAITKLQKASGQAISALLAIVLNDQAPASARVSGAKIILETAVKTVEIEDIQVRLTALEKIALEKGETKWR